MKNVLVVGAGNRVYSYYFQVLKDLNASDNIKVCGILNRTEKNTKSFVKEFGCPYFKDLESLKEAELEKLENQILEVKNKSRNEIRDVEKRA